MFKKIFLITACVTLCSPLQAMNYFYVAAASTGSQIAQGRDLWSVAKSALLTTVFYAFLKFCYGGKKQTLPQPQQPRQPNNQGDQNNQEVVNDVLDRNKGLSDENAQLRRENAQLRRENALSGNQGNAQNPQQAGHTEIQEQDEAFQRAEREAQFQDTLNEKNQRINDLTTENQNLKARIEALESKPKQEQDIVKSGQLNEIMACLQRLLRSQIAKTKDFKDAIGSILQALQKQQSLEDLTFEQTPQ